ncbi:sigma-70 family RNA polymerase sigma factor [Saccharopolyspora rhizosphaerae]|uniref:Sigma-70 family RNA polymerase sigma factor n=1 Tax=Saccharopolyspora rhizosphaerae TaxID=2492662 RepID=A0A426JHZ4_9PSEU|nr:sigma-70 family RNA polymerase sigma factor [Saccharopolyspora rhizosphaerae]RRO12808.1 sigma-70 family RNA polymerase sigma factor [Saccharopolyspora rhizosphaerae]
MPAGDDRELLRNVRAGSMVAFAELYARHQAAAHTMAFQVAPVPADADDLVSEAFTKILDVLRRGGGPDRAFRAYLLTTVRNLASAAGARSRRTLLAADLDDYCEPQEPVPCTDPVTEELERARVSEAFAQLPKRWRQVLWSVEVEDQKPSDLSRRYNISRNGAAALVYRARKGLRQAYNQSRPSRTLVGAA